MATLKVNGEIYKQLVIYGAANLRANYKVIDALNVFPVPDGDTGTNMSLTFQSAVRELINCKSNKIADLNSHIWDRCGNCGI